MDQNAEEIPTPTPTPSLSQEEQVRKFAERLYTVLLGRDADPAGLDYWAGVLELGESRHNVGAGMLNSAEFGGVCAEYGIEQGKVELE